MLAPILAIFLMQAAQPVPPPVPQATADCGNPVYASDQLVCGDAQLRDIDRRLASVLDQRRFADQRLLEGDQSWFRRRSRCAFAEAHRACLIAAYAERAALVDAMARAPAAAMPARCTAPAPVPPVTLEFGDGGKVLIVRDAQSAAMLGAAVAMAPSGDWKPFATFSRKSRQVRIMSGTGGTWRCTIAKA